MTCTTILCLTAALFAQVKLELFPQPAPVQLQMFPASEPVTLKLFPEPAKHDGEDLEKQLVPPPIEVPPAAPKLATVYVYQVPWCNKSRPVMEEYRAAIARGDLLPFVMKYRPGPDWMQTCPTIHYPSKFSPNGWDTFQGDWPGLKEFTRIYLKANPPRSQKMGSQPIRRVELTTRELIRQLPPVPHKGVDGDIVLHLREHGWTGSLNGLTYQELDKLHDAIHAGVITPSGQIRVETRSRFRRKLQSTRHVASVQPKRFDPFLVMSIISIVLDLSKVFCPNHKEFRCVVSSSRY